MLTNRPALLLQFDSTTGVWSSVEDQTPHPLLLPSMSSYKNALLMGDVVHLTVDGEIVCSLDGKNVPLTEIDLDELAFHIYNLVNTGCVDAKIVPSEQLEALIDSLMCDEEILEDTVDALLTEFVSPGA